MDNLYEIYKTLENPTSETKVRKSLRIRRAHKETESVIKRAFMMRGRGLWFRCDFTDEFCKHKKNSNCTPTLSKTRAKSECFTHSVHKTTLIPVPKPDMVNIRKQEHSNIP